jgi:Caudovirus prohead serine protease
MSAGIVCGYAILWGEESGNLSKPGEPATYDRIQQGAILIARTARANLHHYRETAFASTSDRTLEIGTDNVGVWFAAEIRDDAAGIDLANGLAGGRWLGVSPELEEITKRFDARTGAHVVSRATLTGLAIGQRGSALFAGTRAWLAGDIPDERQAAALHESFAARQRYHAEPVSIPEMPSAMKAALRMARR